MLLKAEERYRGGREGEKGRAITRTTLHRQTPRSHPRCRCTLQRYDGTGWQPHRCQSDPSSPAPAGPPFYAGCNLVGWPAAGQYENHQQALAEV